MKDDTMSVTVRIPASGQGYIQYVTSRMGPYQAEYDESASEAVFLTVMRSALPETEIRLRCLAHDKPVR
jgi:hypothetical protein